MIYDTLWTNHGAILSNFIFFLFRRAHKSLVKVEWWRKKGFLKDVKKKLFDKILIKRRQLLSKFYDIFVAYTL